MLAQAMLTDIILNLESVQNQVQFVLFYPVRIEANEAAKQLMNDLDVSADSWYHLPTPSSTEKASNLTELLSHALSVIAPFTE